MNRKSVKFKQGMIWINNKPALVFSGELHYYKLPPGEWQDRLEKVKAAGLNCVSTYFPWNWHEVEEGKFDFSSAEKDAGNFLDIATKLGLFVIARPGPYICNEWDLGGHPAWLLKKEAEFRTSDSEYLKWCDYWYSKINKIIVPRQITKGGSIILYQVENEHIWGDKKLYDTLANISIKDGIEVPIVGNHDGAAAQCGSEIYDGNDIYPEVGDLLRWRSFYIEYMKSMLGPEKPLFVYECHGSHLNSWGGDLATTPQIVPVKWTDMRDKMFLGVGVAGLNYFMIGGGIVHPDFGCDSSITTYMDEAAITPWGELHPRFYKTRMFGSLIDSLNEEFAISKAVNIGWGTNNKYVESLCRKGEKSTFFFLLNHSNVKQNCNIVYEDNPVYSSFPVRLEADEAICLVSDLKLDENLKLEYCSSQIFRVIKGKNKISIIVYGKKGAVGTASFLVGDKAKRVKISFRHLPEVDIHSLKISSNLMLELFSTTEEIASHTWMFHFNKEEYPLFSNIDLVRRAKEEQGVVVLDAEQEADKLICLAIPSKNPIKISINDKSLSTRVSKDGLVRAEFDLPKPPEVKIDFNGDWEVMYEPAWMQVGFDDNSWEEINLYGKDPYIVLNNGYFFYRKTFNVTGDSLPRLLSFFGANGEAVIYLNGKLIGVMPDIRPSPVEGWQIDLDISKAIRKGENLLAVGMEVVGRPCHGLKFFSGITHPVGLSRDSKEYFLNKWKVAPQEGKIWTEEELNGKPLFAKPNLDISSWEEINISPGSYDIVPVYKERGWRNVRWYRTKIKIQEEFREGSVLLILPQVDESWVYVNGGCIGRSYYVGKTCYDLTPYIKKEELEITIAIRYRWRGNLGLKKAPILRLADKIITGKWKFRKGLIGGKEVNRKSKTENGDIIWLRKEVKIDKPQGLMAPVYLEMIDWHTKARIYFNEFPLGLYHEIGPQTKFYIPDEYIKEKNILTICLDGYGKYPEIGKINFGSYYRALSIEIKIRGDFL